MKNGTCKNEIGCFSNQPIWDDKVKIAGHASSKIFTLGREIDSRV
jgi:hypothetical protein